MGEATPPCSMINKTMEQRTKSIKNLMSYLPVRRGNWILHVSVFKRTYVMVIYRHYYETENIGIKQFNNEANAIAFIEDLITKE